jgi:TRAP-type C4-dicarboxylate transport system permease small subunit
MVATMVLIVVNIILRAVFNKPIIGTIDYVMFLTALMIGLSLAFCAVQKAHIAVDFLMERLPLKLQAVIDMVMGILSLVFWSLCTWQTTVYANKMAVAGVVSSTTQTPVYPFIYMIAFGLLALTLVLLSNTVENCLKVFSTADVSATAPKATAIENI